MNREQARKQCETLRKEISTWDDRKKRMAFYQEVIMAKGKGFSKAPQVAKGSGRTDGGTKVSGDGKGNTVGKTTIKHGK